MKFKDRNLRAIAETIIGNAEHFPYRSSTRITQFFEERDPNFVYDASLQHNKAISLSIGPSLPCASVNCDATRKEANK